METANLNWLQIKIMVPINHPLLLSFRAYQIIS